MNSVVTPNHIETMCNNNDVIDIEDNYGRTALQMLLTNPITNNRQDEFEGILSARAVPCAEPVNTGILGPFSLLRTTAAPPPVAPTTTVQTLGAVNKSGSSSSSDDESGD